jgi:hypothetical protein
VIYGILIFFYYKASCSASIAGSSKNLLSQLLLQWLSWSTGNHNCWYLKQKSTCTKKQKKEKKFRWRFVCLDQPWTWLCSQKRLLHLLSATIVRWRLSTCPCTMFESRSPPWTSKKPQLPACCNIVIGIKSWRVIDVHSQFVNATESIHTQLIDDWEWRYGKDEGT